MSETLELTKQLISKQSVTPDDAGCQDLIVTRLEPLQFTVERLRFTGVSNVWLRHGQGNPLFVFAGHTDVVPTGPEDSWQSNPFIPTIRNHKLYGRGAADMKGSVAAMVIACAEFVKLHPDHNGALGLLLTSDEEGPAVNGTVKVIETLKKRGEKIDWCVVGEPSSTETLGDTIKNGRRGSLSGKITFVGKQGHVAYPQYARNPIHEAAPVILDLISTRWDDGNTDFSPTSFQISNCDAGTGVQNVIPGRFTVEFNFRYSTEVTEKTLQTRVQQILDKHGIPYELNWISSGQPFLTKLGNLTTACIDIIESITGRQPVLSTAGGTSDARFIAPTGAQVIEIGPVNASIHQANEHVGVDDLDTLTRIYLGIVKRMLEG